MGGAYEANRFSIGCFACGVRRVDMQPGDRARENVQNAAKSLDLQCNEGAGNCKALSSGNYLMVELPKNYGMYDCQNVEMYRGDSEKPESAQKVGEYCLVE